MTDIFIRTYAKDYPWLDYAVHSIAHYVSGYRKVVIAYPHTDPTPTFSRRVPPNIEFVPVEDLANGYIGQQYTKLCAPMLTNAPFILYWDSDCVATRPFDIRKEYMDAKGRPILLYSTWEHVGGGAGRWRPITEHAIGIDPPYEFMRCMPMLHDALAVYDTIGIIEERHGMGMRDYLSSVKGNAFSEFNAMGAVAYVRHKERYRFMSAEDNALNHPCQQFWSHGGLGETERSIIHSLLGIK